MTVGPVPWMETNDVAVAPPPVRARVWRINSCDSFRMATLGVFVPNPTDPDNSHLAVVDAIDANGQKYVFFVDELTCRVQVLYDFTPTVSQISLSTYAEIGPGFKATAIQVPPEGIPLGNSFWSSGIYIDVPTYGLADGAAVPNPLVPQVGAVSPVPTNGPLIDGTGIGGRSAIFCDQAGAKYLSANALTSLVSGSDKPLSVIARVKRDWPLSSRSAWGFGNSAQSTNDFLHGAFPGGAGSSPTFIKDAIAEATKTVTGPGPIDYADHIVAWVTDGLTGTIYVDGVLVATGDLDTLAITPNRFAIGARFTTAVVDILGGWISHYAMTTNVMTLSDVQTVTTAWRAADLNYPGTLLGAPFQFFGDSITQGDSDTYATSSTRGGFRYDLYEWLRHNQKRVNFVGHRTQGIFADPEHSSIGGADTTLIRSYINTYIPTYQPRGIFIMAGTNDSDNIEGGTLTMAAWSSNILGALADARTRLDAYSANGQIVVTTITPLDAAVAGNTVISAMNTQLQTVVWPAHEAAYPGKPLLIKCDFFTAIGGVYSAPLYKDGTHPNQLGYRLLGAELVSKTNAYMASIAT